MEKSPSKRNRDADTNHPSEPKKPRTEAPKDRPQSQIYQLLCTLEPNEVIREGDSFGCALDNEAVKLTLELLTDAAVKEDVRGLNALEIVSRRNHGMHSAESVAHGRGFTPTNRDVFISTYPKCGTTWVTQIVHVLRGGTEDFIEITERCPWDIMALDCGQDLNASQEGTHRVFKSHETWDKIAKVPEGSPEARYIYVLRNPHDAFVSFYKFMPAYMGLLPDDMTMQEFADAIFAGASHSGTIWSHFKTWWRVRARSNVLLLFFEDLKDNLEASVEQIAEFMGLSSRATGGLAKKNPELLRTAVTRASFKYMLSRGSQFNDNFVFDHVKVKMGLGPYRTVGATKVRKGGGKVGARKSIPASIKETLSRRWVEVLSKDTGFGNYQEMRSALSQMRN